MLHLVENVIQFRSVVHLFTNVVDGFTAGFMVAVGFLSLYKWLFLPYAQRHMTVYELC